MMSNVPLSITLTEWGGFSLKDSVAFLHLPSFYITDPHVHHFLRQAKVWVQQGNSSFLTEVCNIDHFWESYGRYAMPGLPMG